MSRTIHDAIIVQSFSQEYALKAWAEAVHLSLPTTPVVTAPINGFCTFMIAPTGSHEGWAETEAFEVARSNWLEWADHQIKLANQSIPHDGAFLTYIHVRWGEVSEAGAKNAAIVRRKLGST